MSNKIADYGQYLIRCLPKFIQRATIYQGELSIHVAPKSIPVVLHFLRDHSNAHYKQLVELTAVDWPSRQNRFELIYALLSLSYNSRLLVRSWANELDPVPTAAHLFKSAMWAEREVYDMYGVVFEGHPDLRRILTDYGFEGHPMRKDFPLSGYTEVRWDEEKKRIVSEPVELTQEFRTFDFPSPDTRKAPKKKKNELFLVILPSGDLMQRALGDEDELQCIEFRQISKDFTLKVPKDLHDASAIASPPISSLLVSSNLYGLLIFPTKGGFGWAGMPESSKPSTLVLNHIGLPNGASANALCTSADGRMVIVAADSTIYVYDLDQIKKETREKAKFDLGRSVIALKTFGTVVLALTRAKTLHAFSLPNLTLISNGSNFENVRLISTTSDGAFFVDEKDNIVYLDRNLKPDRASFAGASESQISSLYSLSSETVVFSFTKDEEARIAVVQKKKDWRYFEDPTRPRNVGKSHPIFLHLSNWGTDLQDLVLIGNFASGTIGIVGRQRSADPFKSFYLSLDEFCAQLPMSSNSVDDSSPIGMAWDFTNAATVLSFTNPDDPPHPPSPVVWILTNEGVLCPFRVIKNNQATKYHAMKEPVQAVLSLPPALVTKDAGNIRISEKVESQTTQVSAPKPAGRVKEDLGKLKNVLAQEVIQFDSQFANDTAQLRSISSRNSEMIEVVREQAKQVDQVEQSIDRVSAFCTKETLQKLNQFEKGLRVLMLEAQTCKNSIQLFHCAPSRSKDSLQRLESMSNGGLKQLQKSISDLEQFIGTLKDKQDGNTSPTVLNIFRIIESHNLIAANLKDSVNELRNRIAFRHAGDSDVSALLKKMALSVKNTGKFAIITKKLRDGPLRIQKVQSQRGLYLLPKPSMTEPLFPVGIKETASSPIRPTTADTIMDKKYQVFAKTPIEIKKEQAEQEIFQEEKKIELRIARPELERQPEILESKDEQEIDMQEAETAQDKDAEEALNEKDERIEEAMNLDSMSFCTTTTDIPAAANTLFQTDISNFNSLGSGPTLSSFAPSGDMFKPNLDFSPAESPLNTPTKPQTSGTSIGFGQPSALGTGSIGFGQTSALGQSRVFGPTSPGSNPASNTSFGQGQGSISFGQVNPAGFSFEDSGGFLAFESQNVQDKKDQKKNLPPSFTQFRS